MRCTDLNWECEKFRVPLELCVDLVCSSSRKKSAEPAQDFLNFFCAFALVELDDESDLGEEGSRNVESDTEGTYKHFCQFIFEILIFSST